MQVVVLRATRTVYFIYLLEPTRLVTTLDKPKISDVIILFEYSLNAQVPKYLVLPILFLFVARDLKSC